MTDLYIALQHREIRAHTKLNTPYVCSMIKTLYQNISNHTIHYISVNKGQKLDTRTDCLVEDILNGQRNPIIPPRVDH
jgi:hypothetical protein